MTQEKIDFKIPVFNEKLLYAMKICVFIRKENKVTTLKTISNHVKLDTSTIYECIKLIKDTGKIYGSRGKEGGYVCQGDLTIREIANAITPPIRAKNEFIEKCVCKVLNKLYDATIDDFIF